MNKKTLVIIIIIVILVIVVGLVLFRSPGKPGEKKISPEEGTVIEQEEINEIIDEAIQTQDSSPCAKIAIEANRKACEFSAIIADAGRKGDPAICDQIDEEDTKIACKYNVIVGKALNAKNPSLCETMIDIDKTRVEQCKAEVSSRM